MKEQSSSEGRPRPDAKIEQMVSIPALIRQLANDFSALFSKELALAKMEVSESIGSAKKGAVSLFSGGMVLYAGVLFLLLSAVFGLSEVMDPWLAALIVGGVVTIVGLIMVQSGKSKLKASSFKPEHSVNTFHKDQDAVRGVIK